MMRKRSQTTVVMAIRAAVLSRTTRATAAAALMALVFSGCAGFETAATREAREAERTRLMQDRNRLESELQISEGEKQAAKRQIQRLQAELDALNGDYEQLRKIAYSAAPATSPDDDQRSVDELNELEGVTAERTNSGGIHLTVDQAVLFAAGQSDVSKAGRALLDRLATVLKVQYQHTGVRIAGHTDNQPIKKTKKKYASNWELSSMRACSVLRYLVAVGAIDATRSSAVGYADQLPVADNATKAGRAANRRVEIYVLK